MLELVEAGGALSYILGFWLFLFNRRFRISVIAQWREGGISSKVRLAIDGMIATSMGLGVPALLLWIAVQTGS